VTVARRAKVVPVAMAADRRAEGSFIVHLIRTGVVHAPSSTAR
jgi:methylphosphotriester-DNA--protein-cysteine methyltransferase